MQTTRDLAAPVPGWTPPPVPGDAPLEGRFCRAEPLSPERHAALLFNAFEGHDDVWDFLPYGPFHSAALYHRWVRETVASDTERFYAIYDKDAGAYRGVASFLRINPGSGSIEVGHINFAPSLQRTRAATEVMYLMMAWAFGAGYRRYEWKCDARNLASRRAAQRLGFSYEGIFRQATIVKNKNRDTAWFSIIDGEWPALDEAFRVWLAPENFDPQGQQRERLADLTQLVREGSDPAI